jgi:predicted MFS family arabinose efflux permease
MDRESNIEIKELLEQNLALNEENNRMLRGMRRNQRMAAIWRVVYFAAFLYATYVGYQYVKPYLEQAQAAYTSAIEAQTRIKNILPR